MSEYLQHYDLYHHNTMRLHCVADHVYRPGDIKELIALITKFKSEGSEFKILGGGSNVILPPRMSVPIILMDSVCTQIEYYDDHVEVGASVRMQHLIRSLQEHSLGGIEYLYSVPCQVGGVFL